MKIYSKKIDGYSHIYLLNGLNLPKESLRKYMPLNRFIKSIENDEIVFVEPDIWYDPYESLYYNTDFSRHGYIRENVACMCLTRNYKSNEEAAWNTYCEQDKGVRLSLNLSKLLNVLDSYSENFGCRVYIGEVTYKPKTDIDSVSDTSSIMHRNYCPDVMKTEHYLSLLLLKRLAFEYEREIRIFIVGEKLNYNNKLLSVPCQYDEIGLVSKVFVSPFPKLNPQEENYNSNKRQQLKEYDEIKKNILSKLSCNVYRARLYERRDVIKVML